MVESKLAWRLVLGLALLVAVTGCTNTFRGVQRDLDSLFANRATTSSVASPASASANEGGGEEWVDPR